MTTNRFHHLVGALLALSLARQNLAAADTSLKTLGHSAFQFVGQDYRIVRYGLTLADGQNVYFEYVSACKTGRCPLVIVSAPYDGIDWSGESRDQKWANRPQAGQGYQHADGDGPSPSTATLRYVLVAPDKAVLNSGAALFLPNGISVAIIFHRFYLGRSVKDYIDDFTTAATALSELNDVDGQRLAFMGTSLGGFVAAYAHVHSKLPVKAVVLISPLLDLKHTVDHAASLSEILKNDSTILAQYRNFYDPYLRRIHAAAKKDPSTWTTYTSAQFGRKLKAPTFLFHDTWDNLVPVSSALDLMARRHPLLMPIIYQHNSSIDYRTFALGHHQNLEGYRDESAAAFYLPVVGRILLGETTHQTIYFDLNKVAKALAQFRTDARQGRDISWLKPRLIDWCRDTIKFVDYAGGHSPLTGNQLVKETLNLYWGQTLSENNACAWLKNNIL